MFILLALVLLIGQISGQYDYGSDYGGSDYGSAVPFATNAVQLRSSWGGGGQQHR